MQYLVFLSGDLMFLLHSLHFCCHLPISFSLTMVVIHWKGEPKSHYISLVVAVAAESHYSSLTVSKRAAELGCGWPSTLSPCATRRKLPHTSADRRWNGSDTHVCVALWAQGLGGSRLRCHTQIPPGELYRNAVQGRGSKRMLQKLNLVEDSDDDSVLNIKQITVMYSD